VAGVRHQIRTLMEIEHLLHWARLFGVIDRAVLLRAATRISALSSALSLVIGSVALALAIPTGSLALVAFGLESMVDAGASAVLVWRFRVEGREPLRGAHVEQRARRVIGFVLLAVATYLIAASVRALLVGTVPREATASVVLAAASVVVLPLLAYRKLRLARKLGSPSLRADGLLTAGGAVLAAITLAAILAARYARLEAIDPTAAFVVALILLREAAAALKRPL
jgi:divalent metal cation (Fe/Co/Zn/Cd) transporter